MAKFKVYVETPYVGSRCEAKFEVPDEDLEDLDEHSRNEVIEEYALDARYNILSWGWFDAPEAR